VIAVESIPQTIPDHGVDHLRIAHLHAVAQVNGVWRHAHAFHAANNKYAACALMASCAFATRANRNRKAGSENKRFSQRGYSGNRSLTCGPCPCAAPKI